MVKQKYFGFVVLRFAVFTGQLDRPPRWFQWASCSAEQLPWSKQQHWYVQTASVYKRVENLYGVVLYTVQNCHLFFTNQFFFISLQLVASNIEIVHALHNCLHKILNTQHSCLLLITIQSWYVMCNLPNTVAVQPFLVSWLVHLLDSRGCCTATFRRENIWIESLSYNEHLHYHCSGKQSTYIILLCLTW